MAPRSSTQSNQLKTLIEKSISLIKELSRWTVKAFKAEVLLKALRE